MIQAIRKTERVAYDVRELRTCLVRSAAIDNI